MSDQQDPLQPLIDLADRHPVFSPRHGLRYRWWRDIPWGLVVTCVTTMLIFFTATLILGAWVFDWKAWW